MFSPFFYLVLWCKAVRIVFVRIKHTMLFVFAVACVLQVLDFVFGRICRAQQVTAQTSTAPSIRSNALILQSWNGR